MNPSEMDIRCHRKTYLDTLERWNRYAGAYTYSRLHGHIIRQSYMREIGRKLNTESSKRFNLFRY